MASPNISFDTIPSSIRKPGKYFEFNTKLAVRTLPSNLQHVLIVAQRLATGEVAANTIVDIYDDDQAAQYFGAGSVAHLMARAAIKANRYLRLSLVAVNDAAGGVASTGATTLTNDATTVGFARATVGADRTEVSIAAGDTPTDIAAALVIELSKKSDLPVTVSSAAGVITYTAKNKGELGNEIVLGIEVTAGGMTGAVTPMQNGAVNPDIAPALTAAFSGGHDIIVTAWNDQTNLTALRTHLDNVSGAFEQRGAIGVYGNIDTLAAATTLAGNINNGRITGILEPNAIDASFELAAAYASVIAFEEDPARPLNFLPLTGILPNDVEDRLGRVEQETALANGVTPTEIGPGNHVQIVRAVTTYTLDPQGITDISLLDLTTIRTLDYVRRAIRERISLRFPREKLTRRTEFAVRSEIIDVLIKLEELEIVENVADNLDGVIVERDSQDSSRLNARIPTDVVNGLHVFAGRIDLIL